MKLKLNMWIAGTTLYGQIIYQSESIRHMLDLMTDTVILSKYYNGTIYSVAYPAFGTQSVSAVLYIRGSDKRYDNKVFCRAFHTVKDALWYKKSIEQLVKELNGNIHNNIYKRRSTL